MAWSFRKMSRGEMNADPIEGEFFTPEGLADSLVREAIQNSLDARLNGGPVKVRFHFSGTTGALPSSEASQYFASLWPHVHSIEGGRPNVPAANSPVTYLVVEDFGTRGLCGSTEQDSDADSSGGSPFKDFYYFWRNIGRSRKQDTERGRWGLGKTVFPAASRVNSFFGLTVRAEDERAYLLGQSVLKIHRIATERFCPYGFFSKPASDDFQHPFDDPAFLSNFRKTFNLKRHHEPGLSVVIPFPDLDEIDPSHMTRSAILHYFYPIVRGELVVEVSGDGEQVTIDSTTIEQITSSVPWHETGFTAEQLHRLFRFVRHSLTVKDDELIVLPQPNPPRAPDWNTGRFNPDTVDAIKNQFASKQLVAVRVPLIVRPKRAADRPTHFDVFIEQDDRLPRAEDHYVRQGITISKIATLREKGFRGMVVVNDQPLSTLLGDSENPAHTEWQEKATKLRDRYDWGPFTVRFLRNALQRIVAQLLYIPEGRDENLLKNLFFVEDPQADAKKDKSNNKKPADTDEPTTGTDTPEHESTPSITVQKIAGGFRVKKTDKSPPFSEEIEALVAYEVRKGNAFRKYDPNDFKLTAKPIVITPVDAAVEADCNVLRIKPTGDKFLVEVTGFDTNRDIAVRARLKNPTAKEPPDA